MLRSLREHFSEEVILVNNLSGPMPDEYFDDNCIILDAGGRELSHGEGIDVAVEFLRSRGDLYFIHIEPDCLILGRDWAIRLVDAIMSGAIMAGSYRLPFGPIHPCPTIWDISRISGSFGISERSGNIDTRIFNLSAMVRWLVDCNVCDSGVMMWVRLWDCGIKNWYEAALQGLAKHTINNGDFVHFFCGRLLSPRDRLGDDDFARIERFLY